LLKRIWIAWETQRRSIELSKQFKCKFYIIEHFGILRYLKSIKQTFNILCRDKPDILFVQNPSMILAFIACVYKFFSNCIIVVDRHTTFQLNKKVRPTPQNILFRLLHYFTIRTANLTIVTNTYLATIVENLGGNASVLQDKLPEIPYLENVALKGRMNLLLISSFGQDEPIDTVLSAMRDPLLADTVLYISGNYMKLNSTIRETSPPNVIFTGFLPESDFFRLLRSVDAVMALTTSEYCMLCGCYEAVAAAKPLITSQKDVLKEYFQGALFVNNTSKEIATAIHKIIKRPDFYKKEIEILKFRLQKEWYGTYHAIEIQLSELYNHPGKVK